LIPSAQPAPGVTCKSQTLLLELVEALSRSDLSTSVNGVEGSPRAFIGPNQPACGT